jgi:hypothetical protein
MYHTHDMLWVLPIIGVCLLGAAVTAFLGKRRGSRVPGWLTLTFLLGFVACIAVLTGMREYDEARERAELRGIDPAGVSHLTLGHAGLIKEITEPASVMAVMSELKSIKHDGAHHSHENDFVDIDFKYQQRSYRYDFVRDFDRPQEFHVEAGGGGINSATFGPLIDKLMAQPVQAGVVQ